MVTQALTSVRELSDRLSRVPRLRLATLPTPLDYCPNLTTKLGGPPIWIKRDDQTGLATGGNKTRYLEFVLADAQRRGADAIVISSGNQSNHCRQVAAASAKLGLRNVHLLWGSEPSELDGNVLLDIVLGAEVRYLRMPPGPPNPDVSLEGLEAQFASESPPVDRSVMRRAIQETVEELRQQGRNPYVINTDPPLGLAALGYVACALELLQQMREAELGYAHIFVASGGETQAGLLLGSLLLGSPFHVTGILYQSAKAANRKSHIAAIATDAARLLGYDLEISQDEVDNDASYATQPLFGDSSIRWGPVLDVARAEGILLEPTYSGRAMLAIYDHVKNGRGGPDTIILIHSGGTPLIFPLGRHSFSAVQAAK